MCSASDKMFLDLIDESIKTNLDFDIATTNIFKTIESLSLIFRHAKSDIKIFTKDLRKDIFGHEIIVKDLYNFLSYGSHRNLHIILKTSTQTDIETHPLVQKMRGLKNYSIKFSDEAKISGCNSSFVLADGYYYSLSKDIDGPLRHVDTDKNGQPVNSDNQKRIWSIVNFGDKKTADILDTLFAKYSDAIAPAKTLGYDQ